MKLLPLLVGLGSIIALGPPETVINTAPSDSYDCTIEWYLNGGMVPPFSDPHKYLFSISVTTDVCGQEGENMDELQGKGHIDPPFVTVDEHQCEDEGPATSLSCTTTDYYPVSQCPQWGTLEFVVEGTVGEPESEASLNDETVCGSPE